MLYTSLQWPAQLHLSKEVPKDSTSAVKVCVAVRPLLPLESKCRDVITTPSAYRLSIPKKLEDNQDKVRKGGMCERTGRGNVSGASGSSCSQGRGLDALALVQKRPATL